MAGLFISGWYDAVEKWTISRSPLLTSLQHVAAPLILQTFVGFSTTGLFVVSTIMDDGGMVYAVTSLLILLLKALGTLLTDLNPTRASTAAASANLVRCALAATALAVIQPIIDRVGVGWCFTIFGLLGGLCGPLMVWGIRSGGKLRQQREAEIQEG